MWINKTWLENLGLEMPTTTEEFENVLKAFKDQDPNGNGVADETPLSGSITGWNTGVENPLLCAFLYNDGSSSSYRVNLEDGKVSFAPSMDKFKEGLGLACKPI